MGDEYGTMEELKVPPLGLGNMVVFIGCLQYLVELKRGVMIAVTLKCIHLCHNSQKGCPSAGMDVIHTQIPSYTTRNKNHFILFPFPSYFY